MILAGDIGATHARFGCYAGGERAHTADLATQRFESADALLGDALAALPKGPFDACCLAVAGPVRHAGGDATAQLTNAPLAFSRRAVQARTNAARVRLVNDMVAIGAAVSGLADSRFEALDDVRASAEAGDVKGVLAAGSGLGMTVIANGECLPSEGGHARIAPVGAFERALVAFTESELAEQRGIVTWEHYLSGRGVEALHRAVCGVWGAPPPTLTAVEVTQRGVAEADPICETTVATWAGMLATAAGGLAATALALGGIYLAGSVAAAVVPVLRQAAFRRRFLEATGTALLAEIPLFLVADPRIGVDGAHLLARAQTA